MKVLFDTNVVLDVLLNRVPHVAAAAALFALVDKAVIQGCIGATTITTVSYIAAKSVTKREALRLVKDLLSIFDVAPVDKQVLRRALDLHFVDFEDAVLHEAGKAFGVTAIVTRDPSGFARGSLPVLSPQEALAALSGNK